MPARGIVDRALSASFIAALPRDEQDIVRAKIERIIKSDPLLADREVIEFPYVTELDLFGKQGWMNHRVNGEITRFAAVQIAANGPRNITLGNVAAQSAA